MANKECNYSENTYNSRNILARFSHRTRFSTGLELVQHKEFKSILDYGAGDNRFLIELSKRKFSISMYAYEPVMDIPAKGDITIYTELSEITNKKFDVITCFETLEHFNDSAQKRMLKEFHEMLDEDGSVIISVPVETGFPSLIKNIRRMFLGDKDSSNLKNLVKCFLAMDIPEIREQEGFIFPHIGFKYKDLERNFKEHFTIKKKEPSPFPWLPASLNSQVFYVLSKSS